MPLKKSVSATRNPAIVQAPSAVGPTSIDSLPADAPRLIVGNLRKYAAPVPPQYTKIRIDREDPVLGNPVVLKNKNDELERISVLEEFNTLLQKDLELNGPVSQRLDQIAQRVQQGEPIALMCWCHPKLCHGHSYVKEIERRLFQWNQSLGQPAP